MHEVIVKRWGHQGAVIGLWLGALGCSAGDSDPFGPGALSISGGADDGTTDGPLGDAEGEDDFGKTGPQPSDDDDGGSDDGAGTFGAATTGGDAGDSGAADSEGGDAPEDDESSEGGMADGDDGDPPEPREPGFPMWQNCTQNADCEDGVCVVAEDESGTQYGAYCSGACDVPALDCDDPGSGQADLTCLQTNEGGDVCGLLCQATADCPGGMLCVPISADGSVGACF